MSDSSHAEWRRRRVKRLKRMLIGAFLLVVTIPLALCIWFGCRLHITENQLAEMTAQYEAQLQITDEMQNVINSFDSEAEQEKVTEGTNEDTYDESVLKADEPRKVYLTFDDGPSIYTENILDILDEYGVKATFFVSGEEADSNPERYKEIADRGHTLGIHTYSHVYSDIYKSKNNFIRDFNKIRDFITEMTGTAPVYYRFPGGSSNTVSSADMEQLCEFVESQGVTYFDWNVSSGDATNPMPGKGRIISNVVDNVVKHDTSVVLFHDSGSKYSTVEALPEIIERILAMDNTVILPITEETEVIQHKKINMVEEN